MSAKEATETSIEITDAMIEAGLRAYREHDSRVQEPEGLVIAIFEAMTAVASPKPHSATCEPYPVETGRPRVTDE